MDSIQSPAPSVYLSPQNGIKNNKLNSSSPSSTSIPNQGLADAQNHKSDLRSIKTELFNKLMASQSQINQQSTTKNVCPAIPTPLQGDKVHKATLNKATSNFPTGAKKPTSSSTIAATCDETQPKISNLTNTQLIEDHKIGQILFSKVRGRWYTNDEVVSILTSFASHPEWQTNELQIRPKSGAVLLYSREKVRYRQDGYCWKKRKNGRTTREDHMKLKVQGIECIYGCYVHSAILPTFHRRCYWLLQNPDIVLVHYLNQPPDDQSKLMITFNSSLLEEETRRSWTNEEIIEEIGSVFGGISQIQHTLSINFPSNSASALVTTSPQLPIASKTDVKQTHQEDHHLQGTFETDVNGNEERMIISSPQSQSSQSTSNCEAMNEQMDTTTSDLQQPSCENIISTNSTQQQLVDNNTTYTNSTLVLTDEDELMTTSLITTNAIISGSTLNEDNYSDHEIVTGNSDVMNQQQRGKQTSDNLNCDDPHLQSNGYKKGEQDLNSEDVTISMSLDIGNEFQENNETVIALHNVQPRDSHCFQTYSSSNIIDNNREDRLQDPDSQEITNKMLLEQNPCSPVTQIYNKIVDDIETYAFPLEPNQFDPNHHHHHHHQHQHHHHSELVGISSMPVQPMQINDVDHQRSSQNPHQHQQIHQQLIHQQQQSLQEHDDQQSIFHLAQQFPIHQDISLTNEQDCIDKEEHIGSSTMDLVNCGLFTSNQTHSNSTDKVEDNEVDNTNDNLLLADYNLQANDSDRGVQDDVDDCDLGDLIMGVSSNADSADHNNLIVENNSLDLFNFKSSECTDGRLHTQLGARSSTSDTDTMARLSPLLIPRCNSTGNASPLQPVTMMKSNHHEQRRAQHSGELSDNFLLSTGCAQKIQNVHSNYNGFQQNQRPISLNTTINDSNSCPSASMLSVRATLPIFSQSACPETISDTHHYIESTNSSNFIKLPSESRQNSKHQSNSCNSTLGILLPKALSLDGNGSIHQQQQSLHRVSTSPLVAQDNIELQDNSLLIPTDIINRHVLNHSNTTVRQPFSSNHQVNAVSPVGRTDISTEMPSELSMSQIRNSDNKQGYVSSNVNTTSITSTLSYSAMELSQQDVAAILDSDVGIATSSSELLPILDYVPDWCNTTGGAKVLIVGSWNSLLDPTDSLASNNLKQDHNDFTNHSKFFAAFDDQIVPASLIQDNVLRCYVPSHEQGFITLKILFGKNVVSKHVLFEMRPSCDQAGQRNSNLVHTRTSKSGDLLSESLSNKSSKTNLTHRNSTSSNHSVGAKAFSSFTFQQQQQTSCLSTNSGSASETPKVLSLAESIISAMHKKNNSTLLLSPASKIFNDSSRGATKSECSSRNLDWRLTNSLDIEVYDHHHQLPSHSRQRSVKAAIQRRLNGSRSLSRDSELNSSSYSTGNTIDFNCVEHDPYWHQEPTDALNTQPLTVMTDFSPPLQSVSTNNHATGTFLNQFTAQKRHSSGSSGFPSGYQQFNSAFMPYNQQQQYYHKIALQMQQSQQHQLQHQIPPDPQNLTETSSSGLGSIMSSLSPSNSSLHSPSSGCTGTREIGMARAENQSPTCSCDRQSSSTPTSADFCEYFQASAKTQESFSSLTLNDREQQELYGAAKIIQKAYRTYRGRKRRVSELMPTISNSNSDELLVESDSPHSVTTNTKQVNSSQQQKQKQEVGQVEQDRNHRHSLQRDKSNQRYSPGFSNTCTSAASGFQEVKLSKCYQEREMQAATIIQAYYRRYRQYVHYKRQQSNSCIASKNRPSSAIADSGNLASNFISNEQRYIHQNARLVVDTLPIIIDKATTTHVDRKRFKTAILVNGSSPTSVYCDQNTN